MIAWIASFLSRIRVWLSPSRTDREFMDELESHLEMLADDNIRKGMVPEQARRAARIRLGGSTQLQEINRELRGLPHVETFFHDVRYAFRMLSKSPGFTAVAVLTFALGIGANTAIFSVVDAVLLRSLPYRDPAQLVLMFRVPLQQPDALSSISYRDFTASRERNRVFSEVAGNAFHDLTLTGSGEPSIVNAAAVTPEIFPLLNAKPLAGRTLAPEDSKLGAAAVAVLSENLWRSRFGSNPSLIGHSISLDLRSFTVVGILPASFHYPDGAARQDVWISVAQDPLFGPLMSQPGTGLLVGIGRLRPGVSVRQTQSEMNALSARLAKEFPAEDSGLTVRIQPYREAVVGNVKPALLFLLGAAGLVLLIACANIANLLLSRSTSRGREIAVRFALGAGRARIVRQLLTETALLGLFGGVAGVLVAACGVLSLRSFLPSSLNQIGAIHIGGSVLTFGLLLSLAASLAFGLAPALFATPSNLHTTIKEGGERTGQRGGRSARNFLALAEISVAMVLLVAGGLLTRSFVRVTAANPGFDPNSVIEAEVSLPQFQYSTPALWGPFQTNCSSDFMRSLVCEIPLSPRRSPWTVRGKPPSGSVL